MINKAIIKSGTYEYIDVYRKTEVGEYMGSPKYGYKKVTSSKLASVQPASSKSKVERLVISDNAQGSKINTVMLCITDIFYLQEQDLVKRKNGLWYEVRPIDRFDSDKLPHLESYLTEKESQDVEVV